VYSYMLSLISSSQLAGFGTNHLGSMSQGASLSAHVAFVLCLWEASFLPYPRVERVSALGFITVCRGG